MLSQKNNERNDVLSMGIRQWYISNTGQSPYFDAWALSLLNHLTVLFLFCFFPDHRTTCINSHVLLFGLGNQKLSRYFFLVQHNIHLNSAW